MQNCKNVRIQECENANEIPTGNEERCENFRLIEVGLGILRDGSGPWWEVEGEGFRDRDREMDMDRDQDVIGM